MSWEEEQQHWAEVPFDQLGYRTPDQVLAGGNIRSVMKQFENARYSSWRNVDGLWRQYMGLDEFHGKVLDYGCGSGIESLQYAKSGNQVSPADINQASVGFANRVLAEFGYPVRDAYLIMEDGSLFPKVPEGTFDLAVMNGVLHHLREPVPAVREIHRVLRAGGELRVMVYTDRSWRAATGTEPPDEVTGHPQHGTYNVFHDGETYWCDWYDADRLRARFGQWFELKDWQYIGKGDAWWNVPFGRYGIGILGAR